MKSVVLVVLDGYGIAPEGSGNAIESARPTAIQKLNTSYPSTTLYASGDAVGLPYNEVGNTEVGHLNIGAGRMVLQSLPRINTSIADGSFYTNKALLDAVKHLKKTKGDLHLIGLIGQHQTHASTDHLYALLFFCKENSVKNVFIHVITDGRDSPPKAASENLESLEAFIKRIESGTIASVMGRYYAMDRDLHWERIQKAYTCLTDGSGNMATDWRQVLENSYQNGKSDEFITPTNIVSDDKPIALIKEGDAVVFFNFRIDRPRELTKAFVLPDFEHDANKQFYDTYETKYTKSHLHKNIKPKKVFDRGDKIKNLYFVTMTEYEKDLPVHVAFPPHQITKTLGEILSEKNISQLRIAETEKERFVTYYFNGLSDKAFKGEDRIIVPSKNVNTYDLQPSMSAPEICQAVLQGIREKKHSFILVNFANADMVGHTGNLKATIEAIGVLNDCIEKIVKEVLKQDWILFITGDHGNAEQMISPTTGEVSTEHTSNPVPFIVVSKDFKKDKFTLENGTLSDIAPTILACMGIEKSKQMTGRNLLSIRS